MTNLDRIGALLHPKSIAILGARENPIGWTARIFDNLRRFEFGGPVFPVNPRYRKMWGVTCYPDLGSLPTVADHLVVMRAAPTVAATLREAAAMGTRSATLYASGFSEIGTAEGRGLEDDVRRAIEDTGLAVSGPNCLGNLSARARLLTLPDDRVRELVQGPVAMVGQSGTTTPGIGRSLIDRGMNISYIVTSGNETGLVTADYIDYFVTDPEIRVIFCLIEAVRRSEDFLAACRRARHAGKPVVALKMGGSEGGRAAALAHTGSLAGAMEAFDAIAGDAGVIRVKSADEAINLMEFLIHSPWPPCKGVGALVYSGGLRGLSLDAADRHGVLLPTFSDTTTKRIRELLGDDTRVTNPLDAPGILNQPHGVVLDMIQALVDDPEVGTILIHEDLPPNEGVNDPNRRRTRRVLSVMEAIDQAFLRTGTKPIALISAASYDLTEFIRAARTRFPGIACLNEPERAFRTLALVHHYRDICALGASYQSKGPPSAPGVSPLWDRLRSGARGRAPYALSEPDSKAILQAYGISIPDEGVAASLEEAVEIARSIGYPVVVKAVASVLTHKSDAGAVVVGVDSDQGVRAACRRISENVAAYDNTLSLDGWLVSRAVTGGVELVLGVQRDPEMGPVLMFGGGGVLLELEKDVAFAPPSLSRTRAERLIDDTRAGARLTGYRGEGPFDREAVVDALVGLGKLAGDLGGEIDSIDVNPLVALPRGQGAWALDALVVVRTEGGGRDK